MSMYWTLYWALSSLKDEHEKEIC